ncbi:Flp pilus assembly protein CpaB [Thermomicrobiaceae bacterium CFH 74404]|uniref:Flp pilus assembly protein CpaB n=1 Tax=Thermalbibacter longus TaxID=2951981 RepID=A0AA41WHM1_9BACT|nr:Flp pilus assembly protein CpaB [Thermalbibacter longus]MCM8750610.1 Flp pilus assembly protein CpaB [Thermalbibacter longus]
MLRGGRVFILLGVVLAVVAVLLGIVALSRPNREAAETPAPDEMRVPVVVAARDVPANTVITTADITVTEVPQEEVAPGTAQRADQVVGLVTSGPLVEGQRVLMANLVAPSLGNVVQPGKRAVALPVDRVSALGGLIQPNDTIDIIYSVRVNLTRVVPSEPLEVVDATQGYAQQENLQLPPYGQPPAGPTYPFPGEPGSRFIVTDEGGGNPVTKLVLQNIRVLQVIAGSEPVTPAAEGAAPAQTSAETGEATPTPAPDTAEQAASTLPAVDLLIIEVDPQQAEMITFMLDQQARYQVVLRSRSDQEPATTSGITYDRLVSQYGLPVPATVRLPGGPQ